MAEMFRTAIRYFYQLRYLQWIQIYARLRKRWHRPRLVDLPATPALMPAPGSWVVAVDLPQRRSAATRFRIIDQEHRLSLPDGWADRTPGKKWLMELHTFNFLGSGPEVDDAVLIQDWIKHNSAVSGVGWHPYMTSQRISNWLKWGLAGGELSPAMRSSIAQQVRCLLRVLSYDELDHKLFNNGKTLLFAGYCLEDVDARAWRVRGMALIERFGSELLGDDGGYTGLCPMYHCALLNDMLDIANLLQAFQQPVPDFLGEAIHSARTWLALMCHPDGQFALFNDSAFNVGASPAQLQEYAVRLGLPRLDNAVAGLVHLASSGFARMALGPAVALLDIGRIGPDHAPSHGHADTLTFELSLGTQRVIVDTGLSTYEQLPARIIQRGTAAHNTVLVDERNSSDVWQLFKVGRRAAVSGVVVEKSSGCSRVAASHDGYSRALRPLLHRREWLLTDTELKITDRVSGRGEHDVRVAFHLHPDVLARQVQPNKFMLLTVNGVSLGELELDPGLRTAIIPYDYHPGFSQSLPATCIVGQTSGALPLEFSSRISWVA